MDADHECRCFGSGADLLCCSKVVRVDVASSSIIANCEESDMPLNKVLPLFVIDLIEELEGIVKQELLLSKLKAPNRGRLS